MMRYYVYSPRPNPQRDLFFFFMGMWVLLVLQLLIRS